MLVKDHESMNGIICESSASHSQPSMLAAAFFIFSQGIAKELK